MTAQTEYACHNCGATEYVTAPNAYDVYAAKVGGLHLEKRELICDEFKLFCRECGERAPAEIEGATGKSTKRIL